MVPFAAGVNRCTALKSGFDGEITPHRMTSRSARAAHEITQTSELVPASTSASTMPSESIIRNQELIQIGTMYAVLLIGLITAGAGLLGIFSVITTPVAHLYLIGARISIL